MSTAFRNFRAENRRAFVKKVYVSFKDEDKAKLLLRDLDTLLWKLTIKRGAEVRRDLLIKGLREIANELEKEGEEFNRAALMLGEAPNVKLYMRRRPRFQRPLEPEPEVIGGVEWNPEDHGHNIEDTKETLNDYHEFFNDEPPPCKEPKDDTDVEI
jgi:hypothetical protein